MFSLSTDYEDFDAEVTDIKYEKKKEGKTKKHGNSKKLSKKNSVNAVIDEFGKICTTCKMRNQYPTASSCSSGLLIQCLLNDRVRRIGTVCF